MSETRLMVADDIRVGARFIHGITGAICRITEVDASGRSPLYVPNGGVLTWWPGNFLRDVRPQLITR